MKKSVILPPLVILLLMASNAGFSSDVKSRGPSFEQAASVSDGDFGGPIDGLYESAAVDTYCIVWYSFESMNWQGWTRDAADGQYGAYSGLAGNLVDKDPCGDNLSTQIVFFVGSNEMSWSYPGLSDTPFCAGPGRISAPCQDEFVVSPIIDLERYSTACNESQNAAIPAGDLSALGGCSLRFTVYRDLPLRNLVFHVWRVRNVDNGRPGRWLDRNLVYYGEDRDYAFLRESIGDLVASDSIQIALGVVDMCDAWYRAAGDCARHTPAPWFDNVRLYRYRSAGPQWSWRDMDLFQDNFPSNELDIEGYVRADAARDVNPRDNPVIRPGDSIVVSCASPLGGGLALAGGRPAVYLHVRCRYVGPAPAKPLLFGAQLAGNYGTYVNYTNGWTFIQGVPASRGGSSVEGAYAFDLDDSLFTRGYLIEYYFSARDVAGGQTSLPRWALSTGPYFEFTCLPTLATDVLFVDDSSGRGSFSGTVEDYWNPVFKAVLPWPNQPDRYDVNAPTSGVSNGPGSRAKTPFLTRAYSRIVWDSGNLSSLTISDGGAHSDKSSDCWMLVDWLNASEHNCGLWICGDNVAEDLHALGSTPALELMETWCGVDLAAPSYFEATGGIGGGIVSPLVTGDSEAAIFVHTGVPDKFGVFGGCFMLNRFDCLEKTADGSYALDYLAHGGTSYRAGISSCGTNPPGARIRTMWFGFSYQYVRDDGPSAPQDRFELARDVFEWMASMSYDRCDISHPRPPAADRLFQNAPNPFNPLETPQTWIEFAVRRRGFVKITIYDVAGRLVRTLLHEKKPAGRWNVAWDGTNDQGADVASGIYFCRMETGPFSDARKIVLVR